jgi:Protein of unknown function (DUF998)
MHPLLRPSGPLSPRTVRATTLLLLLASAVLVALAAIAMPIPYSWRTYSISESAAQGQLHAWIARLSFLCFGSAVLLLSLNRKPVWGRGAYWSHFLFAVCMLGTAAFSHKPWVPGVPFDAFEDVLHSVTATGMGFAFAAGVVVRFFQREPAATAARVLDVTALLAATVLSPIGAALPEAGGMLQRAMFAAAYIWYGAEALALVRLSEHTPHDA